jgi:hypothetical protein
MTFVFELMVTGPAHFCLHKSKRQTRAIRRFVVFEYDIPTPMMP